MTHPQIQRLARQAAARHESDPTMSTEDCIAAAIVEALQQDRQADDRLTDTRLFLPVDFVRGREQAIAAALSFDPAVDRDLETCARRLYAERDDALRRLARIETKVSASKGAMEP